MKRIYFILLALCLMGCAKEEASRELHSEADLTGLKVGVTAGSAYDLRLSSRDDITLLRYNTLSDELQALKQGQIDVIAKDNCSLTRGEMRRLGVRVAFFGNDSLPCGIPFRKSDKALCDSLSHFIDSLSATGELKQLVARWRECDDPSAATMPDLGPQPRGKTLKVGVCLELAPIAYQVGDTWRGFEAEVIQRFGRHVGRPVSLQYYPFSSILPALQAGGIDLIIGGVYITEERQREMLFSSSYFSACTAYTVKDGTEASAGFGTRMKEMVHNNLVVEDRWRYITGGLWETVKISLCAILFGSLLGAAVCWMRMSRRRWIAGTASAYINLMRGIPMLVFLMIMFYVVFAGTGLSGSAVAVISFALVFAAYVSEMFRTAIQAVGKEQTEAGLALGFTRWQTARLIVAPQALRNVMPVYKGQVITLIKGTSIVGYIAIQDLTRAGDIIRTRTFDAFFPLLVVTVLYFLLAWLIGKVLDLAVAPHNTRRRAAKAAKRAIKKNPNTTIEKMTEREKPQVQTTELLRTSQSWDGAELPDYPQGRPELVCRKYIFPAGERLPLHHHPVMNLGILAEGELTIVCTDGRRKTIHAGEAIVEMVDTVHYGENSGAHDAVLYMFYLSQQGTPLSVQQAKEN